MGSVAKSYVRKGFLIYEEMRKYLTIYEEAISQIRLCNGSFYLRKNLIFFFISVTDHFPAELTNRSTL
jgi:hypothetical protein